jgi:hypothetical protein
LLAPSSALQLHSIVFGSVVENTQAKSVGAAVNAGSGPATAGVTARTTASKAVESIGTLSIQFLLER